MIVLNTNNFIDRSRFFKHKSRSQEQTSWLFLIYKKISLRRKNKAKMFLLFQSAKRNKYESLLYSNNATLSCKTEFTNNGQDDG